MKTLASEPQSIANPRTWIGRIRSLVSRDRARREISHSDPQEMERIARELSLSPSDFYTIAARNNKNTGKLLTHRLSHLELPKSDLPGADGKVLRDLQRVCANCSSTAQCARDLAKQSSIPDFPDYCPNDQTLRAIKQAATLRKIDSARQDEH